MNRVIPFYTSPVWVIRQKSYFRVKPRRTRCGRKQGAFPAAQKRVRRNDRPPRNRKNQLDVGILVNPLHDPSIREMPLFYEPLLVMDTVRLNIYSAPLPPGAGDLPTIFSSHSFSITDLFSSTSVLNFCTADLSLWLSRLSFWM